MGKIREFSIFASSDGKYLAGSTVQGNVVIDLKQLKEISAAIKIVLSGQAQIRWGGSPQSRYVNGRHVRTQVRSDAQTIFDDKTVYLFDTPPESQGLSAGKHEFPYAFQLPHNIPSSHRDLHGHIQYILTAVMPTRKRDITRQKLIEVDGHVRIDTPQLTRPVFDSSEKMIDCLCCVCCMSAPIALSCTIDKGGYMRGEKITVRANHGYRRITKLHAILRRATTYRLRTGECTYSYKTIASIADIDFIPSQTDDKIGHLNIPYTVFSINCDVLEVSYSVIVKLIIRLPNVKNLTISLPITIGNAILSSQPGASMYPTSQPNAPLYPSVPNAPVYPMLDTQQNTSTYTEPSVMPSASPCMSTVDSSTKYCYTTSCSIKQ